MNLKSLLKWSLFLISSSGVVFGSTVFFFFLFTLPIQDSNAESVLVLNSPELLGSAVTSTPANPGLPVRLTIPRIKVSAAVDYVGLTPDGAMGIPKIPRNVAWFNLGPRPGEVGNALIAGHVNWWNGAASAFANLSKLKVGDKIYIKDDTGATTTFSVRLLRAYGYTEAAPDVFISNDGKAHLNLITCIGTWNKKLRSYSKRLVIFTDKE